MNISDEELHAVVRAAIARHVKAHDNRPVAAPAPGSHHPSHVLVRIAAGGESDGSCVIEPAVACTHCGYCQSYGH